MAAFLKIIFFASALQSFLFHGRHPIMLFVHLCVHVGLHWADEVCLGLWCTLGVLKSWKNLQPEHGKKHSRDVENTMWGRILILNTIISQLNIIIKELVRLKISLQQSLLMSMWHSHSSRCREFPISKATISFHTNFILRKLPCYSRILNLLASCFLAVWFLL